MENLKQVFKKNKTKYKTLSPLEARIVDELLKYDNLQFESNFPVGVYYIDIAFPKHKVGLEIDGRDYHTSEEQIARDELREEILTTAYGWKIERVNGWFCYRYPEITVAKVLRHIPEVQDNPLFQEACLKAKQWYIRDLLNTGNKARAIEILSKK